MTSTKNLSSLAFTSQLTLQDVKQATQEELEMKDAPDGRTLLYNASWACSVEIVEAILDRGVDIDGISYVGWLSNTSLGNMI
jgi:hypothetical protein